MKWTGMYLVGFLFLMGGVFLALWKMGVLERIGTFWASIAALIVVGIGIMIAVSNSGRKETIEIDSK
jgi:hypothetical protein